LRGPILIRWTLRPARGARRIGTPANLIAPGKRMLSSQAPTVVLHDGCMQFVTGSPGGRALPSTVLWVVRSVLKFGLDPRVAVDVPRIHHPWFPDVLTLEGPRWSPATRASLQVMGHRVRIDSIPSDSHSVVVDLRTGHRHSVADRRRGTTKAEGD